LHSPDILAVQEVGDLAVLQDLADQIGADSGGAVSYTPYLEPGNDIGGINVGFLVQPHIQVDAITQLGKDELFTFDTPPSFLHDRPPLLLEGQCQLAYGTYPISVMVVHNRSLSGIETERTQRKRFEQAASIATKIDSLQTADPSVRLVVLGDFNAFEFTDGYVDVVGIIKGNFDPSESSVCDLADCTVVDDVDPDLTNLVPLLAPDQRYSFIFEGNSQALDHALVSQALGIEVSGAEFGRGNADAPLDLGNDDGSVIPANLPLRASDHDGMVVFIDKDEDADGVPNDNDVCPGTVIPEGVPTVRLGVNRWALTDEDGIFDTTSSRGRGPKLGFTVGDTAGCSCEQIIAELGVGNGHTMFGCSNGVMRNWVKLVSP
jgi:endonuclease/exonuclease/phosphatase family metal-dependent hydrolase